MKKLEQHDGDQCCPNLNAHRVGGGAHEGLDLEVLFESFEEELDLPALLIDCGNGGGAQMVKIGHQHEFLLFVLEPDFDPSVCALDRSASLKNLKLDGFVGPDWPILRKGVLLGNLAVCIGLEPGNETHALRAPAFKPLAPTGKTSWPQTGPSLQIP